MMRLALARLRASLRRTYENRVERAHLDKFQRFYESLENKRDIYYVFFTHGLLHWLHKTLMFVPPNVNIVIVAAGLTKQEQEWITSNLHRPFHHVDLVVDDVTVWEFLFQVNRFNFGWVDVDCFVLNPKLFEEMSQIEDDVAINTTWTFPGPRNTSILCTHFLFMNRRAIEQVTAATGASPGTYSYVGSKEGRNFSRYAHSLVPSAQQVELLRKVLPVDGTGRPVEPQKSSAFYFPCFDTLIVYQLIAQALGYRLKSVRTLDGRETTEKSSELIHVSGIGSYEHQCDKNGIYYQYRLQLDCLLLRQHAPFLPAEYQARLTRMEQNCASRGLDVNAFGAFLKGELLQIGVPGETVQLHLQR